VLSQKVCLKNNAAEYIGTFSDLVRETGETFIMRSFMVCFPRRMIKSGMLWKTCGYKVFVKISEGKSYLEDVGIYGRTLLK